MTVDMMDELLRAIAETKKNKEISKGRNILEHFCYRAYKNDAVLNAFMRKLIPDRTFSINDIRGGGDIHVIFEIIDKKAKTDDDIENVQEGKIINDIEEKEEE